jgi:uncharacterized protein DUF4440
MKQAKENTTMNASRPAIREFFEQYERSRNTFDPDVIDSQYPDAFMFAGPNGVRVTEKPTVLAALSKGRELLKALGHRTTTLVSLNETSLDDHYAMVRAQFVWRFEKATVPIDVDVDSTFILYVKDGVVRIVFQHEREDFQEALRTRGVLPAGA